ncbi:MAG: D-tyrosyl-tRNA(Tyr) deacylase [Clostridia bacterium]|nr:D-tyrosyl-tRNA(Tyr) deacylase [Clostridia bacterium]
MRALLQRVRSASVEIEGERTALIGPGLLVFLGVTHDDGPDDLDWLAGKVSRLRIFEDENGKMNRSVTESGGAVLVVSQFTLYADTRRGNRPGFDQAVRPDLANSLYEDFCTTLRALGLMVATGQFAADMLVSLQNDGPVTILLDSAERKASRHLRAEEKP